jgi:hypothetical protein
MRKASRKKHVKFLKKWFEIFDNHFFEGFFKDKNIKITIMDVDFDTEGIADCEDGEIIITQECLNRCKSYGKREVLLHEMIHLFVAYAHPDGKKRWDDRWTVFKQFDRHFQKLRRKHFEKS